MCITTVFSLLFLVPHFVFSVYSKASPSPLLWHHASSPPSERCPRWMSRIGLRRGRTRTGPSIEVLVGSEQPSHLSWPLCPCGRSYYNGPKLRVTCAHFLPFKSCFGWSMQTYRNIARCRVGLGSDEAWPGTEYTGYGNLVQKYLATPHYQCLELLKHVYLTAHSAAATAFSSIFALAQSVVMEWTAESCRHVHVRTSPSPLRPLSPHCVAVFERLCLTCVHQTDEQINFIPKTKHWAKTEEKSLVIVIACTHRQLPC